MNLGYVYYNQALTEAVVIDTRAMGLADDEEGTIELKKGDFEKYFKSGINHDPVYGEKTEAEFKDIIKRWPDNKTAYWCLMNYYQQADRHDDLLNFVPEVASAFRDEGYGLVDYLLPYAVRYMHDNKYELASSYYQKLAVFYPKSAPVLSSNGVAVLSMGDLDGGMKLFNSAYRIDDKDPIILSNLAEANIYKQQFEVAEDFLNQLLKVKPDRTEAYYRLATLKMRFGPDASKKAWEKYLAQNKIHPDNEQWADSAERILRGIKNGLGDGDLLDLAGSFSRSKAAFYAVPILAYLNEKDPKNFNYPYLFAQAYEVGGFPEISYGYVKKAAKIANGLATDEGINIAGVNYNAGRLAYMIGKFGESLDYFKIVEKNDRKYPNVQYMTGMTYQQLGQTKEAMRKYQECIDMENNSEFIGYCKSNLKELKSGG